MAWVGSGREEIKLAVEGDGDPAGPLLLLSQPTSGPPILRAEKKKEKKTTHGAVSDRRDWPGLALTFRRPPLEESSELSLSRQPSPSPFGLPSPLPN